MFWRGFRIRHPFYPGLPATDATGACGRHRVLAGSFAALEEAACRGACASHAVFVLVPEDGPLATAAQRERLWTRFRVPSFVLVTDRRGRVVAFECEAQQGFHLAGKSVAADDGPLCRCGRPGRWLAVFERTPEAAESLQVGYSRNGVRYQHEP